MKIAYRRMSGPIGFTDLETGTRGLWLEKRNALVAELTRRGHQVDFINRMTKFSQLAAPATFDGSHELLFVEFGGSNESFYGKDLEETRRLVDAHKGRIVFLCDDPDLPYMWKTVTKPGSWAVWQNATRPQPFGGQPESVPCFDTPFAALMDALAPLPRATGGLVYIGRAKGREKAFQAIFEAGVPLQVYGRAKEWPEWCPVQVQEAPDQSHRKAFYGAQLACLVVADRKHKKFGWRTGRAYHALYAGCPVVVEADHAALSSSFASFESPDVLLEWVKKLPGARKSLWEREMKLASEDRKIFEQTFREFGL